MAEHNDLGAIGEEIAFQYLIKKGFKIKERNWRFTPYEIDIVAIDKDELVIVEVKTRSAAIYEEPGESITTSKIRFLTNAAQAYIETYEIDLETRFDVVFIKWFGDGKYELEHIEGAFIPPVN